VDFLHVCGRRREFGKLLKKHGINPKDFARGA
jgi:hypothetical protein